MNHWYYGKMVETTDFKRDDVSWSLLLFYMFTYVFVCASCCCFVLFSRFRQESPSGGLILVFSNVVALLSSLAWPSMFH